MRRRILQAVAAGAASAVVLTAAPATSMAHTGAGEHPSDDTRAVKKADVKLSPLAKKIAAKGWKADHNKKLPKGWGRAERGAVTGKGVYRHLKKFQAIADANDGNRAAGTAGYEASGKYIEKKLRLAGYKPVRQDFIARTYKNDSVSVEVPGVTLNPIAMSFSTSTPAGGVTGELVAPSEVLGCTEAAYAGVDAAGKIAVVSRGSCPFADKAAAAGAVGAAAVIIYNNTSGDLNGTLGAANPASAPAVGVTQEEGAALVAALGTTGSFDVQGVSKEVETFNIIAETKAGRDDNVVMLGAHLDGVDEGPGINDNASGSSAILETAIKLGKDGANRTKGLKGLVAKKKFKNKVRFAWWGAEESGLQGSTHYVSELSEEDAEKIAVYLNFDMVGSPNYIIGVYDADESTYPAPVEVPEGSAAAEKAFTDYFDKIGQPWVDTEFSGRSDYQAFIENGIPATGLFTGADGTKTEEEVELFGGTAGIIYDPNYHKAEDDIDNVSKEALDINGRAIGVVTRQLAKSTEAINGVK